MARTFDGVNQYLQVGSVPLTRHPLTMACWFKSNDDTIQQAPFSISNHTDVLTLSIHALFVSGSVGGDPVRAQFDGGAIADTTAGYTAGTWHHAFGAFYGLTNVYALIDGGNQGNGFQGNPQADPDRMSIGALDWNNAVGTFFDGSIAEVALWDTNLQPAVAALLAEGASPLLVNPEHLICYWPLIRDDIDIVGGYNMTAYNSPTFTEHPRVLYPKPIKLATLGASTPSVDYRARIVWAYTGRECPPMPGGAIMKEDGDYILLEDGGKILLE